MYELIVTEPFSRRLDDGGRLRAYLVGEHITDAAEVDALLAGGNPHHLVKVPYARRFAIVRDNKVTAIISPPEAPSGDLADGIKLVDITDLECEPGYVFTEPGSFSAPPPEPAPKLAKPDAVAKAIAAVPNPSAAPSA